MKSVYSVILIHLAKKVALFEVGGRGKAENKIQAFKRMKPDEADRQNISTKVTQ